MLHLKTMRVITDTNHPIGLRISRGQITIVTSRSLSTIFNSIVSFFFFFFSECSLLLVIASILIVSYTWNSTLSIFGIGFGVVFSFSFFFFLPFFLFVVLHTARGFSPHEDGFVFSRCLVSVVVVHARAQLINSNSLTVESLPWQPGGLNAMSIKLIVTPFGQVSLACLVANRYYTFATYGFMRFYWTVVGLVASAKVIRRRIWKKRKISARTCKFYREIYHSIIQISKVSENRIVFLQLEMGTIFIVYEPRETTISPLCIFTFSVR